MRLAVLPLLASSSTAFQLGASRTAHAKRISSALAVASWYDSGARLEPPVEHVKEWPALGGSGAWHPMRGPWPKAPVREQWVPPASWIPPTKLKRLADPVESAVSMETLRAEGEAVVARRSELQAALAKKRNSAIAPPAVPATSVQSWYDSGGRLESDSDMAKEQDEEDVPEAASGSAAGVVVPSSSFEAPAPAGFEWGVTV